MRDVEVMEKMEDSASENSEVIESYQNIISRIQNSKWRSADGWTDKHPSSDSSDFDDVIS